MEDPAKRVFINELVCEGCGDCSTASNCLSVIPVETEFGRKRAIDQSTCNKDFSCVNGFCPSFVTVHGGGLRKHKPKSGDARFAPLPEPALPGLGEPYGILITGVGGTGVVTIGALLGMAAHIEGKGCSILDMTGLAQKGGAVFSHVRLAERPEDIHAVRLAAGGARLLLGCDIVVAATFDGLAKIAQGQTRAVINTEEAVTGDFTRNPDLEFPLETLKTMIADATGPGATDFVDATRLATALLGDSIATNPFMLGFAYQKGLIPVSGAAIERAIELNGVAVEANKRAFLFGRRAAHDPAAIDRLAAEMSPDSQPAALAQTLDEILAKRVEFLTGYQDAAYAERYRLLVERVRHIEAEKTPGLTGLAEAVARYYFKLLAYKDEYEVARLYTDPRFRQALARHFEGDYRLEFHLAPPLLNPRDPDSGKPIKKRYGPWMMKVFGLLARLKFLRGGAFDLFGRTAERRLERQLITDYEALIGEILEKLDHDRHRLAVALASLPEQIRGYGHVKQAHLDKTLKRQKELLAAFRAPAERQTAAE